MPDEESSQLHRLLKIPGRVAMFVGAGVVVGVLLIGVLALLRPRDGSGQSNFPAAAIRQISGFKFYYLKPGFSTDFQLQKDTINYSHGILVYSMKNPAGKTLAFTEQHTPPHFEADSLQTTKQFGTEYGQAYITDQPDRTTGALFTNDTWVLINAPDPVGADTMEQLLGALAPSSN